jgi:hypothetical protein
MATDSVCTLRWLALVERVEGWRWGSGIGEGWRDDIEEAGEDAEDILCKYQESLERADESEDDGLIPLGMG